MLVNYSKAFDTVNYKTLLTKLRHIGFSYDAAIRMLSYLSDSKQFVQVDEKKSSEETVRFGVPQGSVLGPILFNLYTFDLQEIITGNNCQYADDTTNYEHCKPPKITQTIQQQNVRLHLQHKWSEEIPSCM